MARSMLQLEHTQQARACTIVNTTVKLSRTNLELQGSEAGGAERAALAAGSRRAEVPQRAPPRCRRRTLACQLQGAQEAHGGQEDDEAALDKRGALCGRPWGRALVSASLQFGGHAGGAMQASGMRACTLPHMTHAARACEFGPACKTRSPGTALVGICCRGFRRVGDAPACAWRAEQSCRCCGVRARARCPCSCW